MYKTVFDQFGIHNNIVSVRLLVNCRKANVQTQL